MSAPPANPYVGPRAFDEGEAPRFFGRERELEGLFHLLIARRLVLLHSPSGAGKSSLIRAALIPRLRREEFVVHPVIRVGLAAAAGVGGNPFVAAALLSLDEGRPAGERLAPEELARLSLGDYLARRPAPAAEEVFIFDQFEELLTAGPSARPDQEAFIAQLADLLEDPRRWALFALREDYLGALKPLAQPIPTRLATTFRLDLLDPAQAVQAMRGPARMAGAEFEPAAAQRLADDLRRTIVQRPDGSGAAVLGQAIEPVQLQVVCYRIWERRQAAGGPAVISEADIAEAGTVDAALRAYYAEQVAVAAAAAGVGERAVRDWCEGSLISERGLRGQVLREPEQTGGLANSAVQALVNAHLVRAEERRGATWFELAHDRLVEPVRADNAAWRAANLSPAQQQAALWERQGRPDSLLLRGAELAEAERRAAQESLSPVEQEFLAESRQAQAAAERERRANRRIRWLAFGALLGLLVASALAVVALLQSEAARRAEERASGEAGRARTAEAAAVAAQGTAQAEAALARSAEAIAVAERDRADAQGRIALSRQVALLSQSLRESQTDLAMLLAVEAARLSQNSTAINNLIDSLEQSLPVVEVRGEAGIRAARSGTIAIAGTAVSRDGSRAAFWFFNGDVQVWDVAANREVDRFNARVGSFVSMSFSGDSRLIAVASGQSSATILVRDTEQQQTLAGLPLQQSPSISFGADDSLVVIGSAPMLIWNWQSGETREIGGAIGARRVAASPDGRLVAATSDQGVTVVNLQSGESRALDVTAMGGPRSGLRGISFSPDSSLLAAGGFQGVLLWETAEFAEVGLLRGNAGGAPLSLAFSRDGRQVALGNYSGNLAVWQIGPELLPGIPLAAEWAEAESIPAAIYRQHLGLVYGLAGRPDGLFVSASTEGAVLVWDFAAEHRLRRALGPVVLAPGSAALLERPAPLFLSSGEGTTELRDGGGAVVLTISGSPEVAVSPDGAVVAVGEAVGSVALLNGRTGAPLGLRWRAPRDGLSGLSFSPDGATLAASVAGRTYLLDAATLGPRAEIPAAPIQFSGDGRTLAGWTADGRLGLWESAGGASAGEIPVAPGPDSSPAAQFQPLPAADGGWLVVDSVQQELLAFDAAGRPRGEPLSRAEGWQQIRMVQGGRALALLFAADEGTSLELRDPASLQLIARHGLPARMGADATLSPDGSRLAQNVCTRAIGPPFRRECGGYTLLIYEPATESLFDIDPRSGPEIPLAFSADGSQLFTMPRSEESGGAFYGDLSVWDLDRASWEAQACAVANRNMSPAEWRRDLGPDLPYRETCPGAPTPGE